LGSCIENKVVKKGERRILGILTEHGGGENCLVGMRKFTRQRIIPVCRIKMRNEGSGSYKKNLSIKREAGGIVQVFT